MYLQSVQPRFPIVIRAGHGSHGLGKVNTFSGFFSEKFKILAIIQAFVNLRNLCNLSCGFFFL